jgi:hypothetical protein
MKLPPAIIVPDELVVPAVLRNCADVVVPENRAPRVEFRVIPADMVANPVIEAPGVNPSALNIATRVLPEYIEAITLLTAESLVTVSILNPDSVCPDV